jgi:phosphate transport system substrate-binding protein
MLRTSRWAWPVAVLAVFSLAAAACGSDDDSSSSSSSTSSGGGGGGSIVISGSSTVQPISSLVGEKFKAENPDVGITVDGPGTGDGFELFCNGETDISDASRPIEPEEVQACEANDIEFIELQVGIDGISVLTNPANDAVECLDNAAIYALVGPESTGFDTWSAANDLASEVGSAYTDLPDVALDITGPGEESGTYDTFVEFAIEGIAEERDQEPQTRPDYTSSPNDNVIVEGIEASDTSFGWVGFAFYTEEKERLRAISIAGEDGTCVEPTEETIASGEYPYSRPLFIYVNKAKAEENSTLSDFVDFYLGDTGFAAVADAGYIQVPDDVWTTTKQTWSDMTTGTTAGG